MSCPDRPAGFREERVIPYIPKICYCFFLPFAYNIVVRRFTVCGRETLFIQARFTMYGSGTLFTQTRFTMCGRETLFTSLRREPEAFFDKTTFDNAEVLLWLNAGYTMQPLILHK